MLGSGNEVILNSLGHFHEGCGEACDTHNEVLVFVRVLLGIVKLIHGYHVELHLHAAQVEEGLDNVLDLLLARGIGQNRLGELDVQLVAVADIDMRQLGCAVQVSGGTVLVHALLRGNGFRQRIPGLTAVRGGPVKVPGLQVPLGPVALLMMSQNCSMAQVAHLSARSSLLP